jgi:hypothetical protein
MINATINVMQVRERDQQQGMNNERYTQSGKLRRKYARKEALNNTTTTGGGVVSTSQAVMSTQGANVRVVTHQLTHLLINQPISMCCIELFYSFVRLLFLSIDAFEYVCV